MKLIDESLQKLVVSYSLYIHKIDVGDGSCDEEIRYFSTAMADGYVLRRKARGATRRSRIVGSGLSIVLWLMIGLLDYPPELGE